MAVSTRLSVTDNSAAIDQALTQHNASVPDLVSVTNVDGMDYETNI